MALSHRKEEILQWTIDNFKVWPPSSFELEVPMPADCDFIMTNESCLPAVVCKKTFTVVTSLDWWYRTMKIKGQVNGIRE